MPHDILLNQDWQDIVDQLGGAEVLEASARSTGAFQRARAVANASDLLRLILTYCLGEGGLCSAVTWASAAPNVSPGTAAQALFPRSQAGS